MDFDRMPNEIRLKIFLELPFEERVRSARVSKLFQQMSRMAVSKTRVFNLTADICQDTNGTSMWRLVKLCAGNLRQVVHSCWHQGLSCQRLKMLSKVPCPRLETLDVSWGWIENGVLRSLLGNSPNLRSFTWKGCLATFPSDVVCETLERVEFKWCTSKFFESIVQGCPNLKHIVLHLDAWSELERWEQLLNKTFASKLALETLELRDWDDEGVRVDHLENLWGLTELRSLALTCREISDQTMIKISKSFGQLERLRLDLPSHAQQKVSSRGIGALSSLKRLREVEFSQHPHGGFDIDRGAWHLAECGRLQVVHFTDRLSPETTRAFVQCCPMLRRLSLWSIEGVDTSEVAKKFVESLSGFIQKNLQISLHSDADGHRIWQDKEVKEAVGRVNATANGRSIWVSYWFGNKSGAGDYISICPSTGNRTAKTWDEWDEEENTLQLVFGDDASTA